MRNLSEIAPSAGTRVSTATRVVLHQLLQSMQRRGIPTEALLPTGSSLESPPHLIEHVPLDLLLTVWRRALLRTGERALPIDVAIEAQERPASMLGFLCRASSTPRNAVQALIRFWPQVTSASKWSLSESRSRAVLSLQPLLALDGYCPSASVDWMGGSLEQDALGWQCQLEFDLFDVSLGLRALLQNDSVLVLGFPYTLPEGYERRIDALGFGRCYTSHQHCIDFSPDLLDIPLLQSDPQLASFLEMQLGEGQNPPFPISDLVEQVRALLAVQLELGEPFLDRVAHQLGRSRRTLQRQLEDSGFSFRQVLDEVRLEQSRLLSIRLKADALAEKLGYSDARALRRARKRWTGRAKDGASQGS